MQAVILAAGMGRRLKDLTQNNTKCMVKVNGVTLIERMLHQIDEQHLSRIVIVVGYERQKLIDSCLQQELPISDWYPSVQPMFGDQTELYGIQWHENHILNFPLLVSEDIIDEICKTIISCTKK